MSDEYEAAYEDGRRDAMEEMEAEMVESYEAGVRDGESNAREAGALTAEGFADLLRFGSLPYLEGVEVWWDAAARAIYARHPEIGEVKLW